MPRSSVDLNTQYLLLGRIDPVPGKGRLGFSVDFVQLKTGDGSPSASRSISHWGLGSYRCHEQTLRKHFNSGFEERAPGNRVVYLYRKL